ncbi:MAG TPA: amidohydrolase family protein [Myxococcales bacterium]|nr:amidohydrolase family protein [Myxococcales bacterium]
MIVDAHVHLFPHRLAEAVRRWFDEHAWGIRYRSSVDEAIGTLQKGGIDRCVVLPYAHKPGMASALNDFTLELARAHPEVVPCCTAFPGEDGIERLLDEALGEQGFHGVKIHSHVMRVAPDDPRLDPVWRASARHRKPVVIHCGREPASGEYGVDVRALSGAARLRRALVRHPEAICIVPHLGMDEPAAFEALLGEFENLYLDTTMAIAGYFPDAPDLEMLRRRPERILYGTDFPNLPYEWDRELRVIRGLRLAPAQEQLILSGNAVRLFAIE